MTVQRNALFCYFHDKDTHTSCEMNSGVTITK